MSDHSSTNSPIDVVGVIEDKGDGFPSRAVLRVNGEFWSVPIPPGSVGDFKAAHARYLGEDLDAIAEKQIRALRLR
jgi:hypothetical protein